MYLLIKCSPFIPSQILANLNSVHSPAFISSSCRVFDHLVVHLFLQCQAHIWHCGFVCEEDDILALVMMSSISVVMLAAGPVFSGRRQ